MCESLCYVYEYLIAVFFLSASTGLKMQHVGKTIYASVYVRICWHHKQNTYKNPTRPLAIKMMKQTRAYLYLIPEADHMTSARYMFEKL